MSQPLDHPYLVPFDGSFRVADAPTEPSKKAPGKKEAEEELEDAVKRIARMQRRLYAADNHALLLMFQAMDAAGKDGTIRAVLTGVDPAGCQVYSFKAPSHEELDHDFLWRTAQRLPERGRIGVFNRSWYEEVLVVRVHPEILGGQRLPSYDPATIWAERHESIRDFERHLARNGTVILKFWLNVSRAEQKKRFLARLEEPDKNWKFDVRDVEERRHWEAYMAAYEDALNATSRPWAPWYAIPADDKPVMRLTVAKIVAKTLEDLGLDFPEVHEAERARLERVRKALEAE